MDKELWTSDQTLIVSKILPVSARPSAASVNHGPHPMRSIQQPVQPWHPPPALRIDSRASAPSRQTAGSPPGHLLLGSDSHSSKGIMQSRWEKNQVRQLMMGDLLFTPEQSKRMSVAALARIEQQRANLSSTSAAPQN